MGPRCSCNVDKKSVVLVVTVLLQLIEHGKANRNICQLSKVESSDGEYKLIGFFPITDASTSKMSSQALLWSEMMRYEIKRSNKKFQPRKIFGYTMYNTCTTELNVISEAVLEVLLDSKTISTYYQGKYCPCFNSNFPLFKTIGIIGPARSSNTQYVNELLLFNNLPVISYASTSPELSDQNNYPNFFRTSPPDTFQAKFIKDVLIKFNWMYVSIIASDDTYGRSGLQYLKTEFEKTKICLGVEEIISSSLTHKALHGVLQTLKRDKIGNVVILWGYFKVIQTILQASRYYDFYNKTWIVSEASGRNDWFVNNGNQISGTLLLVVPDSGRNVDFENYFWNLTYKNSQDSPWLQQFFEKQNINKADNTDLTLDYFRNLFDMGSIAGYVQKAVSIYVQAIEEYMNGTMNCDVRSSNCKTAQIISHKLFNHVYIKEMKFREAGNKFFQFNYNGEIANPAFDLLVVREYSFQLLIHWSSSERIIIKNSQLARQLSSIESHCSKDCLPGFYPVFSGSNKCCWQCFPCATDHIKPIGSNDYCTKCKFNHISNKNRTKCIMLEYSFIRYRSKEAYIIYILSAIGVLATLVIMITFIIARNSPVVRSSNIRISLTQLMFHIILFLMTYLYLERETKTKCIARTYIIGVLFVIVIAITLSKITHIVSVFNLKYRLTKWKAIQLKTMELLIVGVSILIKVCVSIALFEYSPVVITYHKNREKGEFQEKCNIDHQNIFQVCYILILQIICGVQAFRGRKLPANYNEAKYVAFAMFTSTLTIVVGILIASSMEDLNEDKLVTSATSIVANISLLLILYGYKVKIIWFYPELNTTEVFQRERMKRMAAAVEKKMSTVTCVSIKSLNERNKVLVREIMQRNRQLSKKVNSGLSDYSDEEERETNLAPIQIEGNTAIYGPCSEAAGLQQLFN